MEGLATVSVLYRQHSFRDLTEVWGLRGAASVWSGNTVKTDIEAAAKALSALPIATEFAFCTTNHGGQTRYSTRPTLEWEELKEVGWQPVAKRLNWWTSHNGDCPITLWWKKFTPGALVEQANRSSKYGGLDTMAGGGCEAMLLNGWDKRDVRQNGQRLGLLRLPNEERTPLRVSRLQRRGFRLLDEGTLASYWALGMLPSKWSAEADRALHLRELSTTPDTPGEEVD